MLLVQTISNSNNNISGAPGEANNFAKPFHKPQYILSCPKGKLVMKSVPFNAIDGQPIVIQHNPLTLATVIIIHRSRVQPSPVRLS